MRRRGLRSACAKRSHCASSACAPWLFKSGSLPCQRAQDAPQHAIDVWYHSAHDWHACDQQACTPALNNQLPTSICVQGAALEAMRAKDGEERAALEAARAALAGRPYTCALRARADGGRVCLYCIFRSASCHVGIICRMLRFTCSETVRAGLVLQTLRVLDQAPS